MTNFIVDASAAAAWFLPDEASDATDRLMQALRVAGGRSPSLFWFEVRNLFLMAERRGRLRPGEAALSMVQLRALPIRDAGGGDDAIVFSLAARHALSGYDASYLALAVRLAIPLATLDRKLAAAARAESVEVLGPLVCE